MNILTSFNLGLNLYIPNFILFHFWKLIAYFGKNNFGFILDRFVSGSFLVTIVSYLFLVKNFCLEPPLILFMKTDPEYSFTVGPEHLNNS